MNDDLERELERARPVPEPGFRGALGRRVGAAWVPGTRPTRLWLRAGALSALGLVLLVVGALQI